jgi:hypothetical protein
VRLAHARRPEEEDVGRLADEGEGGELLDLALVDRGLKAEVELVQGAVKWQMGQPGPGSEVPLPPDAALAKRSARKSA